MYEYVDSNSDRIGLFKQGLYNLDCYQIANRNYYITDCGFLKSPTADLAALLTSNRLSTKEQRAKKATKPKEKEKNKK